MKLLTKELLAQFKKIGRQDSASDPIVVAKFFNPSGAGTWYATEYDPKQEVFFGFVDLGIPGCAEWGTFGLEELQSVRTMFGLGIERDRYFNSKPFSQIVR